MKGGKMGVDHNTWAIRAQSHVLQNEQLAADIPEVYEPHVGRTI